jgi:hypothetical protein
MRPSPLQAIIVGAATAAFSAYWLVSMILIDPPGQLTSKQLAFIEGRVSSLGDVGIKRGYGTLEIWIEGQVLPFRCFDGPYPGSFDQSTLAELGAGKHVRVGLESAELKAPRTNLAQGQSFYSFVSLEIEGKSALTLEAYNVWSKQNIRVGFIVMPLLMFGGAYYVLSGLAARRNNKPTI